MESSVGNEKNLLGEEQDSYIYERSFFLKSVGPIQSPTEEVAFVFDWILLENRVLLTSVLKTPFKDFRLRYYSLKKFNVPISVTLHAQVFIKMYYLKSLKSVFRALVSIFLENILTFF